MIKNSISLFAIVVSLFFLISSGAQAAPPATLTMKVAIGLGFHVCPERKTLPPLQEAYLCSGLAASPQTVELTLVNQPAAKPTWLFYEVPYTMTTKFQDIEVTMECLVMYSKVDGVTTGYVDGRLISTKAGVASEPIYFRASATGGLDKFSYSTTYGSMTKVPLSKGMGEFSPYVVIAAPE